jgi:two-component system KDP operon response regulator KdpE
MDLEQHTVRLSEGELRLTPKEFGMLRMLMQGQGRLLTHRMVLSEVWGPEYADDRHVLRTFVHQLRTKLDAALPGAGSWIVTDSGVGYRLVVPES